MQQSWRVLRDRQNFIAPPNPSPILFGCPKHAELGGALILNCTVCGRLFDPKKRPGGNGHEIVTCSPRCSKIRKAEICKKRSVIRWREKHPIKVKICLECKQPIVGGDPRSKYCPGDCSKNATIKRQTRWARIKAHGIPDPVIKRCIGCGLLFQAMNQGKRCQKCVPERNRPHPRKNFKCLECGEILKKNQSKYCSELCAQSVKMSRWIVLWRQKPIVECGICHTRFRGRMSCPKCRRGKYFEHLTQTKNLFQLVGASIAIKQITQTQNETNA